jgi:hypothetical protein
MDDSAFLYEYSRQIMHASFVKRYLEGFERAETADEIDDVLSVIDFDLDHDLRFLRNP